MKSLAPVALVPLIALAACCPVCPQPPVGLPPPPITKAQQLALLNQRARQVQTLKARGSISVTWNDDQGPHSNSADASIMLRQRQPMHPYDPGADVLLQAKIAGSEVFEMGVNVDDHWLAFKVDPKTAYIGKMNTPPTNNPSHRALLRADRVLTVLALAQMGERANTWLAMTSEGEAGGPHVNQLHIIRFADVTGAYIERTLLIDRHTGNVSEIRSYFPDGRVESVATLSDYQPGVNPDSTASAIQFPNKIVIEDPADRSHIELTLGTYIVNPTIPPAAFVMPDFPKQGLQILPAD